MRYGAGKVLPEGRCAPGEAAGTLGRCSGREPRAREERNSKETTWHLWGLGPEHM